MARRITTKRMLLAFAPLGLLALAACGGGGDGGSSSSGGIGGSGIQARSQGPVSAIGSRVVAGTSWDLSNAQITTDGRVANPPFTEADLPLGAVVSVGGTRSADGLTGQASEASFDIRIRGPVDTGSVVDLGNGAISFTIFDLLVTADTTTFLEPASLMVMDGNVVEVSGLPGIDNAVTATRIERIALAPSFGTTQIEVKGVALSPSAGGFDLDLDGDSGTIELEVDRDTFPCSMTNIAAGLDLGASPFVEVRGVLTAATTICADDVEEEDVGVQGNQADLEIDGVVTDFASNASFRIDGTPVNASGASFFPPALAMMLGNGIRVEVEGSLMNGMLTASEVKLRDNEIRVSAAVDRLTDVDLTAGTVTLLGILIQTDAGTSFEDDIASLADILADDFLEVRGYIDLAGDYIATSISGLGFDPDEEVELRGPVEAIVSTAPRMLTILGVQFEAEEPATVFNDFEEEMITADRFYERVRVGDIVEAEDGIGLQTVLDAPQEVEFED